MRESSRRQKSSSEVNSPLASRSRIASFHRALPDILDRGQTVADGIGSAFPRCAAVADRIRVSDPCYNSGLNFNPLRFTSGGRIGMPIRLHSPTKIEILSVLLISLLSKPAMNSTG